MARARHIDTGAHDTKNVVSSEDTCRMDVSIGRKVSYLSQVEAAPEALLGLLPRADPGCIRHQDPGVLEFVFALPPALARFNATVDIRLGWTAAVLFGEEPICSRSVLPACLPNGNPGM